ncbi:M16 family metallopeptidase [Dongia deserti]|uniref:M16 family metallopeptidase n=1 Tax=Dongia deserti TaxID=2268030 RepID=UPI000E64D3B7|nr:pitrilysin family protein [Dongia deserti]
MIMRLLILACVLVLPRWAFALDIQSVKSDSGIEIWLVENHVNPIVSVAFGFKGGSGFDPDGKEGLAKLASGLLDEGAGDIDSETFQKRLTDRGIDFSFDAGLDDFTGRVRFLREDRDEAAQLLGLALTAPRFDAEPVERIRNALLIEIAQDESDPDSVAGRHMEEMVLGSHPYSRPANGTAASMNSITADDLRQFARQRFVRSRLHISIVGDVSAEEARRFVHEAFGSLPQDAALPDMPPIAPSKNGRTRVVDFQVPQAVVQFAQPGIPRSDPDFFSAYLVNYVLGGGGFSARLMEEVREKRGLVYGIGTGLWTFDAGGLVAGQFQTDPGRVAEAIDIVRTEWQRMASEGPTQQELDDAKTYLLGYYPRNFTSTMSTARVLRELQIENLGIDYVTRRQKEIAAVTIEDARRAAKRLFDASQLTFVVVGPADQIQLPGAEVVKTPAQN